METARSGHSGRVSPEPPYSLGKSLNRNLRYAKARVACAILVDPVDQPTDKVAFGARVRVRDPDGEERVFTIVGEDEADAARGKASWVSPLARALRGAQVGDSVTWKRPSGDRDLEVVSIEYAGAGQPLFRR